MTDTSDIDFQVARLKKKIGHVSAPTCSMWMPGRSPGSPVAIGEVQSR